MRGYNDAIQDWTYDPELSKNLLAEADFPDGLSQMTIAEDTIDSDANVIFESGDVLSPRFKYIPADRVNFI